MKKWKKYTLRSFCVLLVLYLFIFTSISSFAAPQNLEVDLDPQEDLIQFDDTEQLTLYATSSGPYNDRLMDTADWLYQNWEDAWRTICHYWVSASDSIVGTYMDFHLWLENQFGDDADQVFEDNPTVTITDTGVDVPQPVQQTVINYVTYCIQQNPLTYTPCYIYSYNFVNPSQFQTYAQYQYFKEYCKNSSGYILAHINSNTGYIYVSQFARDLDIGFVGTVNSSGSFTNARAYINWLDLNNENNSRNWTNKVVILPNGTTTTSSWVNTYTSNIGFRNSTSLAGNYDIILTNFAGKELIYMFQTLNAYKNYNSGFPQSYYLTQLGQDTPLGQWTAQGEFIAGGDLLYYGQTYETITSQTQSGWTAEEVLQLVDLIMSGQGGSGGSGSGSDGSDFDLSFLGTIGRLIGKLITGIGGLIEGILEGIVGAVESILELFVGEDGILSKLTDLISGGFNSFLGDIFSWMPSEIVTCFSACLLIGIFFAIWKIIRG